MLEGAGLESDQLSDLYRNAVAMEGSAEMLADLGPQDEGELWQWFKDRIGVEIPTVAVCPGHVSPFEIACDVHFFRVLRLLWIGSRGGTKTSLMAWLDLLAAETFPGFESWTTGPGLSQGQRKYEHLLPYVVEGGVIGGKELSHVARSTLTETIFKNLSKLGIGPGTVAANNGPRSCRLHRDERELMDSAVYKQAGNIPAGRETPDGRYIPAQIVDTSTMKWAHGSVAQEKEAYEAAIAKDERPRMVVKVSCIFEIAQEVSHCRAAPADQREERLKELDKDPCELCDCHTYVNDVWDEDTEGDLPQRTLEDVCAGRLFKARGFKPLQEIQTLFLENDRATWEAEQECREASKEGVYISSYSQVRNGIRSYEPHPDLGKIYQGIDWGGTDPHSIGWYQLLDHPVEVSSFVGGKRMTLQPGHLVRFAEVYRAGIGNVDVGRMAIAMEDTWRARWPGWKVQERYYDYQNAAGRMDWEKELGLTLTTRIRKNFDEEVKYIRGWVGKAKFYVAIDKCPWFDKAIRAWREEGGHEARGVESNWATHPMAEARYVVHNLRYFERKEAQAQRQESQGQKMLVEPDEEDDLMASGTPRPRRHKPEIFGVTGAEDSPHKAERGTIGGHPWAR